MEGGGLGIQSCFKGGAGIYNDVKGYIGMRRDTREVDSVYRDVSGIGFRVKGQGLKVYLDPRSMWNTVLLDDLDRCYVLMGLVRVQGVGLGIKVLGFEA